MDRRHWLLSQVHLTSKTRISAAIILVVAMLVVVGIGLRAITNRSQVLDQRISDIGAAVETDRAVSPPTQPSPDDESPTEAALADDKDEEFDVTRFAVTKTSGRITLSGLVTGEKATHVHLGGVVGESAVVVRGDGTFSAEYHKSHLGGDVGWISAQATDGNRFSRTAWFLYSQ